ncbi:MAG: YigZ family protein [Coprococcus catus]|nr:YigZ family protein [Coprococcus catus]MDD6343392.1 YigZ family protein [Coprococcus catus]MDY5989890.1 YigZ family protein [Coprococcus catus]
MAEINKVSNYKTVYRGGTAEIVEKKSRFIAHSAHVESEEEALAFIEQIKKQYWDARHNCHAFSVGVTNETARCSDDGEPAQTAGKPMLDVLMGQQLKNTVVVVTRYFGGTLLGTGGLVRAYSAAVQEGLKESLIIEKFLCRRVRMSMDYTMLGKMQYLAAKLNLMILDTLYTEGVEMQLLVPDTQYAAFIKEVTEASNGKVVPESEGLCYGADVEGKIEIFDA